MFAYSTKLIVHIWLFISLVIDTMIIRNKFAFSILLYFALFNLVEANFEDSRCRCTCPNTHLFSSAQNNSDNFRRYYTKTNVISSSCNSQNVVRATVKSVVDETRMDAFLANCDCRFESRNTILLKVVVIFVICVLALLGSYMLFLTILDPMFKRRRASVNYKRQEDDPIEENIFAQAQENGQAATTSSSSIPMRVSRNATNILEKVEVEQSKWQHDVEDQRRKVFTDHTALN